MSQDTTLPANVWNDVYAATGIAPGTPIQIFNKRNELIIAQEGSAPTVGSWDGPFINPMWPWVADQKGVTGCWVKSMGPIVINVQVV
jgi:hypothetical protein